MQEKYPIHYNQQKKEFLIDALHISVLLSFGFAQPLFSLLSRNAEFFVAHHSKPVDILAFISIISVAVPAIAILVEGVVGLFFGRCIRKSLHVCLFGVLVAVILLPALKKVDGISGWVLIVGAIFIGLLITILYIRFLPVRTFFTALTPALLIFPGLFLFNSPVFNAVFPGQGASIATVKIEKPAPIVMVIFDEFPVSSLIDADYKIDPILYPNFYELASKTYWYRNCDSTSPNSLQAISSLLSGLKPKQNQALASSMYYPNNLFTLLGGVYEMNVIEPYTELCPESICTDKTGEEIFKNRIKILFSDLAAIYLHILLPENFVRDLPPITQDWKGFWIEKQGLKLWTYDRISLFNQFLDSLNVSDKPKLHFIHTVIPHLPWEYLPSGKKYGVSLGVPGLELKKEMWGENEWLVIQGYQRHLLQVAFTDRLVGELISKLKKINLYDQSLLILTADHGANFLPNKPRRGVIKEEPKGALGVPLFIKLPYQSKGITLDDHVTSVDLLPTISEILNISLPWIVEGASVLPAADLFENNNSDQFKKEINDILLRKLQIFGLGGGPAGIYNIGTYKNLIGRNIDGANVVDDKSIKVQFDQSLFFKNLDLNSTASPSCITGSIYSKKELSSGLNLAIGINGKLRAVTEIYYNEGAEAKFLAMVPEDSFQNGKNDVDAYIISESGGQLYLTRANSRLNLKYSLGMQPKEDKEIIIASDGLRIPVVPNAVSGWIEVAKEEKNFEIKGGEKDFFIFSGWAVDIKNSQPVEKVLLFINGEFIFPKKPDRERPDVANYFKNRGVKKSGFYIVVPLSNIKEEKDMDVQFFAVSKEGVASKFYSEKISVAPKGEG
jgi:hypothetical protein